MNSEHVTNSVASRLQQILSYIYAMKKFILSMSINIHTIRHSVGRMINTAPPHYEIM